MVWKLQTDVIVEEIYGFLDTNLLIAQEQKGGRRKSRRTNELLCIAKIIVREFEIGKRNLSMVWIDYKKAYDMVPH